MADAFDGIFGQPQVRELLRASVVSEHVTHAYLFTGPTGSNKTQAAYALAQAVMCPKGPQGPRGGNCGSCNTCSRIVCKKHPDVRYYAPEGAAGYLIEQIREIVSDTMFAPIQSNKKVYILDRVDLLNTASANAFLKTLEEPPADVILILLGRTKESVLPTIVSRCQVVPFRHIPASEAAGIVRQNTGAPLEQARQAIEACGGSITGAVEFLSVAGNERLNYRSKVLQMLGTLDQLDDWDVILLVRDLLEKAKAPLDEVRAMQEAEIEENADFLAKSAIRQIETRNKRQLTAKTREYLMQTIAIIESWLRDIMVTCAGTPDLVINTDARESIERASLRCKEEYLSQALRSAQRAKEAIAYNVSPETCLDTLLFDIREVLHGSGIPD